MGLETLVAIGTAVGVSGGGAAAGATGAAIVGAAAYGATEAVKGISKSMKPDISSTNNTNSQKIADLQTQLDDEKTKNAINRRLYRSGTIFTSPTGILSNTSTGTTTSAKLK